MSTGPTFGAPGLYWLGDSPLRTLTGVRMDVCAFVGVAPRGPAREPWFDAAWAPQPCLPGTRVTRSVPVVVESWQAYLLAFGGFDGPGLLPYAVSAFFANGGRRAHVVRIVHDYRQADGTVDIEAGAAGSARSALAGVAAQGGRRVCLLARNEGRWGNGLSATLSYTRQVIGVDGSGLRVDRVRVPPGLGVVPGVTLRLGLAGGAVELRRVTQLIDDWRPGPGQGVRERWALFDSATATAASTVEIVEGRLDVDDGAGSTETLAGLGLASAHPRWLARVLVEESALLWPADDPDRPAGDPLARWLEADLQPGVDLAAATTAVFEGGADRYADLVPDDFFDPDWQPGDECPGDGVQALVDIAELALLVVPDLYSPGPLAAVESIVDAGQGAGASFADCVALPPSPPQGLPAEDLTGLRLDPASELDAIAALQRQLADLAAQLQSFIVLLDVPPGLSQRRMLDWRSRFDTAYAAAYHPWVSMAPAEDPRQRPVAVSPSALAAGIVALREHQFGVPHGPANVVAAGAVGVLDAVSRARHDELHQHAINVFVQDRDGVRLSAGRTLSLDASWRQLNVRRLVTMIRRVLDQQMQWAVFEPNNRELRALLSRLLEAYLRQLYRANAFTGATEAQAFFVKCDDELNPPAVSDQGRLLAQVGVAPAEPMEFIVLNIARSADATLTVEA